MEAMFWAVIRLSLTAVLAAECYGLAMMVAIHNQRTAERAFRRALERIEPAALARNPAGYDRRMIQPRQIEPGIWRYYPTAGDLAVMTHRATGIWRNELSAADTNGDVVPWPVTGWVREDEEIT